MADTAEPPPVPAPDALVVTESDPTDAPNEEQQLEPTKKIKKIIRRKKRPARVQADPSVAKADPSTQSGLTWNIWYSKHEGGQRGDEQHSLNKPAPGRCSIARDSGYTRADRTPGAFFCGRDSKKYPPVSGRCSFYSLVHFARGVCHKGSDCEYLHRLPGIHDLFQPNTDCFGRFVALSWREYLLFTSILNSVQGKAFRLPRRHGRCWKFPAYVQLMAARLQ